MKNSTTALILASMCLIANLIRQDIFMFLSAAIFTSTYLIIKTINKNE